VSTEEALAYVETIDEEYNLPTGKPLGT